MIGSRVVHRAVALTAAAVLVTGGTILFSPLAMAYNQTATITFDEVTVAPAGGTLDNQVEFEIDAGWGAGSAWTLPNDGTPVNYLFDRPVDVRFGVTGLNAEGEAVELPEGVVLDQLAVNHSWDPDTRMVAGPDGTGTDVSTFKLSRTTDLTAVAVGSAGDLRALEFVDVTYNLPAAQINPQGSNQIPAGEGHTLSYSCADGTGKVTSSSATRDGAPINNGDPLATRDYPQSYEYAGTHTIVVTCVDEYGAIDQAAYTYRVISHAPTCGEEYRSLITDQWQRRTEDGLMVFETPYLDLTHPQRSGSPPPLVEVPDVHGISDTVHTYVEPVVDESVDPSMTALGLPPLTPVVHDLNCDLIVPTEDAVDHILIPVVIELKNVLGGLFG